MTVDLWRSDWGDAYHERNVFQPEHVKPLFSKILQGIQLESVLEVGCGLGHNLAAITAGRKYGLEPNDAAREEAERTYPAIEFWDGVASTLPFLDDSMDLVLTCGLLIHIPPHQIQAVIEEISRVAKRYVLAVEYAFPVEEAREYRGQKDALWVRPYGKLLQVWGGLRLVRWDDADSDLHPGCSWWLMQK